LAGDTPAIQLSEEDSIDACIRFIAVERGYIENYQLSNTPESLSDFEAMVA